MRSDIRLRIARPWRRLFAAIITTGLVAAGVVVGPIGLGKAPTAMAAPPDYRSTVVADTPTAYWRLADATGTVAADEMGSHNGVVSGGAIQKEQGVGPGTNSTYFDGASGSVSLGSSAAFKTPNFTLEYWLRPATDGTYPFSWSPGCCGIGQYLQGGRIGIWYFATPTQSYRIESAASYNDLLWHHTVATKDSTTFTLYVDGMKVASQAISGGVNYGTQQSMYLMGYPPGNDWMKGNMQEAALYDHALSADRVRAHYAAMPFYGPGQLERLGSGCLECAETQRNAADPVNNATGDFWHTFSDVKIPGRGQAIDLARTYNSLTANQNSRFGYGWADTYNMSLSFDGSGNATANMWNGSQLPFPLQNGVFAPPSRVLATLVKNADGTYTLSQQDLTKYTFSSAGQLAKLSDRNGYVTAVTYPAGQVIITDPAGRTLTLAINGSGQVSGAADSSGRTVSYQYDGNGNLTTVTDVNGGVTRLAYTDPNNVHLLTVMKDPLCSATGSCLGVRNTYDSSLRATSQTDGMNRQTNFDYTVPGQTKITDPSGNVELDQFQSNVLVSVTKGFGTPEAAIWTYAPDVNTLATTLTTDPNGHVWQKAVDARGNVISTADPLNRTTSASYNALGEPLTQTDALGVTTTSQYDAGGNLTSTSRPLAGSSPAQTQTIAYAHGDATHPGDVTQTTDPNSQNWTYTYDTYGDRQTTTDPLGDKALSCFDALGRQTSAVTPKGTAVGVTCSSTSPAAFTSYFTRNSFGDLLSSTDPLQHLTRRLFDANRNLIQLTDPAGNITKYHFDLDNEADQTTQGFGTAQQSITKTDFNPDGSVLDQVDGLGNPTTYGYDPLGHVTSVKDPLNRTTSYTYDGAGNRLTLKDPQNQTTTDGYDAANQLTSITYSDGTTPNVSGIQYDPNGQRLQMTDGTGTSSWQWDSLYRMTQSTTGAGTATKYGHDLAGNVTSLDYRGDGTKVVTRAYDTAGRLKSVTDWLTNQTTFNYDADSIMTSEVYPNTTTATMTTDGADRLMTISHAPTSAPGSPFAKFSYGRDANNQVSSVATIGLTDNHSYGYTPLNQLSSADSGQYNVDAAGQLTYLPGSPGTFQRYDATNQVTSASTSSAISLVGTAAGGDTSNLSQSVTVALPAGIQASDQILVASTQHAPNNSVNTPVGFTQVAAATSGGSAGANSVLFRKTAAGGETSLTLTYAGFSAKAVVVAVYRGVDNANPIDASSTGVQPLGTTVSPSSINASLTGDQLVMLAGAAGDTNADSWTAPPGMTNRVQQSQTVAEGSLFDQTLAASGATGARTATLAANAQLAGILVALKPAKTVYSYDQRGNRTGISPPNGGSVSTLGYDQASRLATYASGPMSASYGYNGDGLRMSTTVAGVPTQQTWDVSSGMPVLIQDGATSYVTGPGGLPLEQISGSNATYFHQDQLGSTRALTNQAGAVVGTSTYDPYGTVVAQTGIVASFGFSGGWTDGESGLLYLRARYYDPSTGQFISRDSAVAMTRQPYAYVRDNPLNGTDPSGLYDCGWQPWNCIRPDTAGWNQFVGNITNPQAVAVAAIAGVTAGAGALCVVSGACEVAAGAEAGAISTYRAIQATVVLGGAIGLEAIFRNQTLDEGDLRNPSQQLTFPNGPHPQPSPCPPPASPSPSPSSAPYSGYGPYAPSPSP